jgi:hypothetical protein
MFWTSGGSLSLSLVVSGLLDSRHEDSEGRGNSGEGENGIGGRKKKILLAHGLLIMLVKLVSGFLQILKLPEETTLRFQESRLNHQGN